MQLRKKAYRYADGSADQIQEGGLIDTNRSLIIAGVNKAGTTSLFSLLSAHPSIVPSRVKETCFFLPARYGNRVGRPAEYLDFFPSAQSGDFFLDATPGYFYGAERVVAAIKRTVHPDSRIILIFRDPVTRAVSFFRFQKSMLMLDGQLSLRDYVDACMAQTEDEARLEANNSYFGVEGGRYSKYLQPWLTGFGANLLILFTEDLSVRPAETLRHAFDWLELPAENVADIVASSARDNVTVGYRSRGLQAVALHANRFLEPVLRTNPWVKRMLRSLYQRFNARPLRVQDSDDEAVERLKAFYVDSNRELAEMLHEHGIRSLPNWLASG